METKTKLKARRMWADPQLYNRDAILFSYKDRLPDDIPVAVIPLDDVTALITKAGDAFSASYDGHLCQSDIVAMLTAIGVLPKQRKGRK